MDLSSILSHGEDLFSASKSQLDVLHKENPQDHRLDEQALWKEPPTTSGVLTQDGVENIATHEYVPGKYTKLEYILNPYWIKLTDFMPLWLAPNLMTTIGLLLEIACYLVTWMYSEEYGVVPAWVCLFNGTCMFTYYTLDCMDGKQARRTGTSSPLGQLFDHGIDCLSTIAHISTMAANFMLGGSYWLILAQSTLQLSFFMGQWQEYYTGVLEHSYSDYVGVTEVAYGMAIFAMLNAFLDRAAIWTVRMSTLVPFVPEPIASLELRHFLLVGWTGIVLSHVFVSSKSVVNELKEQGTKTTMLAFSKLLCPVLLALSPFLLSPDVIATSARYVSLSLGLAFCIITIKIVVFSMAKMAYASVQWDVVPFVFVCVWSRLDERLTPLGACLLFQLLSCWYIIRVMTWASSAINQLCDRLDINCFTIKHKEKRE